MMKVRLLAILSFVVCLCACSDGKFSVDGTLKEAPQGAVLYLEEANNGNWYLVDSLQVKTSGDFAFEVESPEFPNIFRLRYKQESIYFPIDSLDHIRITTSAKNYIEGAAIEGSDNAKTFLKIDKQALQFANGKGTEAELEGWKRKLAQQLIADPAGIVAYYIINKYIDGQPLFDPRRDFDFKIIGAVANAYNSFKPNDPRTQYMVEQLKAGMAVRRAQRNELDTVYAEMTNLIEIKLQDDKGVDQSLKQVTSQGKVVLLNYTIYSAQFTPAFNKMLNDVYTKLKPRGFEIYQVGLDPSEVNWLRIAKTLPWITVYEPGGERGKSVSAYNVTGVPTIFIFDRKGEVVQRITNVGSAAELEAIIAKYL